MYNDELKHQLESFFSTTQKIVIVQGDNPDADSLASSLALEELLYHRGIEAIMYCSIDVAHHLRHLEGWDRVTTDLPNTYDAWILVDCEYLKLLSNVEAKGDLLSLKAKPLLVIDHHDTPSDIDFARLQIKDVKAGATGQIIYLMAHLLGWDISKKAAEMMTVSILSDTLGFNSEFLNGNSSPLRVVAELVDLGVSIGELNEKRLRQFQISPEIFKYKAELMKRVEFHHDNQIVTVDIPHEEIKEYSMSYNPTVILDDTRMIEGVAVGIGFKTYERNGEIYRVTARIRCSYGYTIADKIASCFPDGGGHPYAAGFKVEGASLDFAEIKNKAIQAAAELLTQSLA